MATPYELGPDGIEIQACNGTGHFSLTVSLLPLLKETAAMPDSHVRIVNVTSAGYLFAHMEKPDFTSLESLNQKAWSTWGRYGLSKLTVRDIVHTVERSRLTAEIDSAEHLVHQRASEAFRWIWNHEYILFICSSWCCKYWTDTRYVAITSHCTSSCDFACSGPLQSWPFLAPLWSLAKMFTMTSEQGALTQLYAATSPEIEEKDLKWVATVVLIFFFAWRMGFLAEPHCYFLLPRRNPSRLLQKIRMVN